MNETKVQKITHHLRLCRDDCSLTELTDSIIAVEQLSADFDPEKTAKSQLEIVNEINYKYRQILKVACHEDSFKRMKESEDTLKSVISNLSFMGAAKVRYEDVVTMVTAVGRKIPAIQHLVSEIAMKRKKLVDLTLSKKKDALKDNMADFCAVQSMITDMNDLLSSAIFEMEMIADKDAISPRFPIHRMSYRT
jgi:hypothetical protein